MSHFSVLVIGDNVEAQLQPYHEFECTGTDDKYVQDIDQTAELREEFENSTTTRVRLPSGEMIERHDDRCYRELTDEEQKKNLGGSGFGGGISWYSKDWGDGRGYRTKVHQLPEGAEEIKFPTKELRTFVDWLEGWHGRKVVPFGEQPDLSKDHKYGYALVDEAGEVVKVVDRTNPNKHWDWWVVGGRWSGFLKLKAGGVGEMGDPGMFGSRANHGAGRADVTTKGAVDFEGMRAEAGRAAAENWDRAAAAAQGESWEPWSVIGPKTGYDEVARETYRSQPAVERLKEAFDAFHDIDQYLTPREEFIQQARDSAVSTFAVVKDGKWFERGSMGWWGAVSDEKDRVEWNRQFNELVDGLPDDTPLTVVDCHI